jgi:hypothetical protein
MKRTGKGKGTAKIENKIRSTATRTPTTAVETRCDFYEGVLYCAKQTALCEAKRLADLLGQSREATAGEIREAAWAAGRSASWLAGWAGWNDLFKRDTRAEGLERLASQAP